MHNFYNLQIHILERHDMYGTEIWLRNQVDGSSFNIHYDGELLVITEIKDFSVKSDLKPFLTLPTPLAQLLFKKISDYNSERGIKTRDENLIEGKLQATEEHLKDMREFAKKLLDSTIKK